MEWDAGGRTTMGSAQLREASLGTPTMRRRAYAIRKIGMNLKVRNMRRKNEPSN